MTRYIIVTFLLLPFALFAQKGHSARLRDAEFYYDNKEYAKSLKIYRELHSEVSKSDSLFSWVAQGLSGTLLFTILEEQKKNNWTNAISIAKEFVKVMDDDKEYIDPGLRNQINWGYKNLIVAYNAIGQHKNTIPFRDALYNAYRNKKLPEGIDEYYNFEKIVFKKQNVWGYEWYNEPDFKSDTVNFVKHVYYIYSQDSTGGDKELLYTLQTVKVHKLNGSEPDFVLTKRYDNVSQTIWAYTFAYPIDYEKLHEAVLGFLNGKAKPDTHSIFKNNK